MTLRMRLGLTILAIAIPLFAAVLWLRGEFDRRVTEQSVREFAHSRAAAAGDAVCDAFGPPRGRRPDGGMDEGGSRRPRLPIEGFAGRRGGGLGGPPIDSFAYDRAFNSATPFAPEFPQALRSALTDQSVASVWADGREGRRVLLVGVKLDDPASPCPFVLSRRPGGFSATRSLFLSGLGLAATFLLAVLVAAGPVVGRIRRLTNDVRRSAADRYATPVAVQGGDEVAELARAFNEAGTELRSYLAQLEAREQTLRAFVANTTHDVMHPLTVLQGHLVALRKAIDSGEAVPRDVVLAAMEESHYLGSLLHNLGSAATLEAGAPAVHHLPVHLQPLVDRVIGRHRPVASLRGIEINHAAPEPALWVTGDVTLLEQAIGNVVQNAVRYNDPGGHVVVLLEEREAEVRSFSLRVIDDGPGITDADLTRLGERSFRGDIARQRHPDGLGLGLHIARDVAARHDFSCEIRRSEYGGLEVEFGGRVRSPEL